ncbi:MAG: BON domain-containing protein [Proteobacteria bacterium]|nr:BON domain-containing protein [Pseudomonadota bacterium]
MFRKYSLCLSLLLSGCAPLAVGGVGSLGMSAVEDRGLSGVTSDQILRMKLNVELSNELSDFTGITLTVYKGRVLLTGVAGSEQVKADAVRIVKNDPDVVEVIDGMNVQGEDGFSEYTRDGWITTKLKTALYADEDVIAPNYLVTTFDKVIYIFGTAETPSEMKKVIETAYDITGVKRVVNLIEVKKESPK